LQSCSAFGGSTNGAALSYNMPRRAAQLARRVSTSLTSLRAMRALMGQPALMKAKPELSGMSIISTMPAFRSWNKKRLLWMIGVEASIRLSINLMVSLWRVWIKTALSLPLLGLTVSSQVQQAPLRR